MSEGGIYIHVPYCRNKCLYCDFYSGGLRIADWDIYLKALFQEFDTRKNELTFHPSTLYIGGGTPSLMPVKILRRLTEFIRQRCKVEDWKEFTIEVNPEDVTSENCMLWKECGVNRISLGIQSLNNEELKKIGRNHSGEEGQKACKEEQEAVAYLGRKASRSYRPGTDEQDEKGIETGFS